MAKPAWVGFAVTVDLAEGPSPVGHAVDVIAGYDGDGKLTGRWLRTDDGAMLAIGVEPFVEFESGERAFPEPTGRRVAVGDGPSREEVADAARALIAEPVDYDALATASELSADDLVKLPRAVEPDFTLRLLLDDIDL